MTNSNEYQIERHIKTHSERSSEDREAIAVLESFLRSNGKINYDFTCNDKWPNIDGKFELVPNPKLSRRPIQNFFVQIKGTNRCYLEKNGILSYCLKSLAFPAYIYKDVTSDPGILFVVINPSERGKERVFWKYMSISFLNSIDFQNDSITIKFEEKDEITNNDESVNLFVEKLIGISNNHSFVKRLENKSYKKSDIEKIILACDKEICDSIEKSKLSGDTRDNLSKIMLNRLEDLCSATLLLNAILNNYNDPTLRVAWEVSLMNINTKFLATFLQFLKYRGMRIPDEGQNERLMLKYYDYLWQIRDYLRKYHNINILHNLEDYPLNIDKEDEEYYKLISNAINEVQGIPTGLNELRYYIENKKEFYVEQNRYFELTLQLAGKYASKFNRIIAYTKENISTNYSIQVGYKETELKLWDSVSKIKVINNWRVSIEPSVLNKFSKIFGEDLRLSSGHGEYSSLMNFLTKTGMNLLDLIDLREKNFNSIIDKIYSKTNTKKFKSLLEHIKRYFSTNCDVKGKNVVRYLLLKLKEESIENIISKNDRWQLNSSLSISKKCFPFENNPFVYNLPRSKTNDKTISKDVIRAVGLKNAKSKLPYIYLKHLIEKTGDIYIKKELIWANDDDIYKYNSSLSSWDRINGAEIKEENDYLYIEAYEKNILFILQELNEYSKRGNSGQNILNNQFIEKNKNILFDDELKKDAIRKLFVDSRLLLIYGAAGTGKTTLMDYISNLMIGRSKLFLAKTHTAVENLQRHITSPGQKSLFINIDKFKYSSINNDYDLVFIDECSTIDNRNMVEILKKLSKDSLIVLAGDIHQIESIDFGNWFNYAKSILPKKSIIELTNTWRTTNNNIISLWDEVRNKGQYIIEKLSIDGPFSKKISSDLFKNRGNDEIVLCLNYDGRFGLNNINSYFQDANGEDKVYTWYEWKYKVGDPVLFNESKRFPRLYNNLKGKILKIEKEENMIKFMVEVETILTDIDSKNNDFTICDNLGNSTKIIFSVYKNNGGETEEEREKARMHSIVPFQVSYAVSIHKSQGLEYDSVKVVIPSSNSEKISHGIFYTAITRAKKQLTIYWSSETMLKVINSFQKDEYENINLDIIRRKLHFNNN